MNFDGKDRLNRDKAALHLAVIAGHDTIVEALLAKGAKIDVKDLD